MPRSSETSNVWLCARPPAKLLRTATPFASAPQHQTQSITDVSGNAHASQADHLSTEISGGDTPVQSLESYRVHPAAATIWQLTAFRSVAQPHSRIACHRQRTVPFQVQHRSRLQNGAGPYFALKTSAVDAPSNAADLCKIHALHGKHSSLKQALLSVT